MCRYRVAACAKTVSSTLSHEVGRREGWGKERKRGVAIDDWKMSGHVLGRGEERWAK